MNAACSPNFPAIQYLTAVYRILPVNSCGYYKFQVEIGAATNRDFNIEIACKT